MGGVIQRIGSIVTDTGKDGKPSTYLSRSISVKLKGARTAQTPSRLINNQEINAKMNAPSEAPLDSIAGIVEIKLNDKALGNLDAFLKNVTIKARKFYPTFAYFPIKGMYINPTDTVNRIFVGYKYDDQKLLLDKLINAFSVTQLNAFIVPPLDADISSYKDLLKHVSNRLEGLDREVEMIVCADPKYNDFPDLVKFVEENFTDTDRTKAIAIKARAYTSHISRYTDFWNTFSNKETLVLHLGVDRTLIDAYNLSGPHYSSLKLGDAFTVKLAPRPPPKDDATPVKSPQIDIEDVMKIFERKNVTMRTIRELINQNGREETIDQILSNLGKMGSANKECIRSSLLAIEGLNKTTDQKIRDNGMQTMSAISKVHEVVNSAKEFKYMRSFIKQTDTHDYIKRKPNLKRYMAV